jgi:hypothetical protein
LLKQELRAAGFVISENIGGIPTAFPFAQLARFSLIRPILPPAKSRGYRTHAVKTATAALASAGLYSPDAPTRRPQPRHSPA